MNIANTMKGEYHPKAGHIAMIKLEIFTIK